MSVESNNQAVYRTAESVSPKHPDKICDQISDAILDAYLAKDPQARVAIEACGGHGALFLTGEVSSSELVDVKQIAAMWKLLSGLHARAQRLPRAWTRAVLAIKE